MKKNILLVIAILWVFTACDNKAKENTTDETTTSETTGTPGVKTSADGNTTVKNNNMTVSNNTNNTVEKSSEEGPKADIKFEKTEHDFGEIAEGTLAKHTFNFTNTGKVPLIIKDARGSCGCTVPDWPRNPIEPGKTGEIKVQFNSQGRSGMQTKTVTLTTNTKAGTQMLQIKAKVKAVAKVKGPVKK